MTQISTDEAENLVDEGVAFVDVRTTEEFADGHVPGALNIPISVSTPAGMQPNADFLKVFSSVFQPGDRVILACKAGGRSARALAALKEAGFTNLLDMSAGFVGTKDAFGSPVPGWSAEGREIATDASAEQIYASLKVRAGL